MEQTTQPQRKSSPWRLFGMTVDIVMLVLIAINLALIVFDWLFALASVQWALAEWTPAFFAFYRDTIHAHFGEIDLGFVAIYLSEFCAQWLIAIWRQRYHRWFFYPFIHWYDLLGCIPVGSFRWLRVLRVVSILIRLHQLGWIDLKQSWLGATAIKYYQVLVEELSDRIVVNVLEGAQEEITQGSPVLEKVEANVLAPRKQELLDLISHYLATRVKQVHATHRGELERYLGQLTDEVLANSSSGRQLRHLPFAQRLLKGQVQQLGLALVDGLAHDISAPENRSAINELLDSLLQTDGDKPLTPLLQDVIYGIIEQIKAQILVQRWKLEEEVKEKLDRNL